MSILSCNASFKFIFLVALFKIYFKKLFLVPYYFLKTLVSWSSLMEALFFLISGGNFDVVVNERFLLFSRLLWSFYLQCQRLLFHD